MVGLPLLCWIRAVRVCTMALILNLTEKFSIFRHWVSCCVPQVVPVVSLPITDYVSCGIVIYGLYYVKVYSIYIQFVKSFYHERMLYLSNAFYASIETIVWCLYFILSVWCIAFIDFHKLRYLHSRDKPCLIMIYDPFNVLLNSVCQYFIEKFYTYTYTFYTPCWAGWSTNCNQDCWEKYQ